MYEDPTTIAKALAGVWKHVLGEDVTVTFEEYDQRDPKDPQSAMLLEYSINGGAFSIYEARDQMPDGAWFSTWPTLIGTYFPGDAHGNPPDMDTTDGPIGASWSNAAARLLAFIAEDKATNWFADLAMEAEYEESYSSVLE